jgi:putative oxidoreductase
MFRKLIATVPTWFTLPVRFTLGLIFFGHGAQKVLGMFGGPGLSAWSTHDAPLSFMRPSWLWMGAAALAELSGGVLVFFGLLTRVGAFLIAITMLVAIFGVHWPNFFLPKGFEYPFALLGMAVALVVAGGGRASIDEMLLNRRGRR